MHIQCCLLQWIRGLLIPQSKYQFNFNSLATLFIGKHKMDTLQREIPDAGVNTQKWCNGRFMWTNAWEFRYCTFQRMEWSCLLIFLFKPISSKVFGIDVCGRLVSLPLRLAKHLLGGRNCPAQSQTSRLPINRHDIVRTQTIYTDSNAVGMSKLFDSSFILSPLLLVDPFDPVQIGLLLARHNP